MNDIAQFSDAELQADLAECLEDIQRCQRALDQGFTTYPAKGKYWSILERRNTNQEIADDIRAEQQRRVQCG